MAREADVIIVGAGLSGLVAAREVLDAGREPLVLEADDRVGGRILTEERRWRPARAGRAVDRRHPPPDAGARRRSSASRSTTSSRTARRSYEFAGEVLRGDAFHAKYAAELTGLERVLRELDRMADTVPVEAPWTAPRADEWDRITVGQWYDSQGLSPVARDLLEICTVGILAMPTVEVSLLVPAGERGRLRGDRRPACRVRGRCPDQALRRRHLTDSARGWPPPSATGSCSNSPVLTIDYSDDRVTVTCRGGLVATGRQVVVALAPTLAGRIMYDPPLPGHTRPADPADAAGVSAQDVRALRRTLLAGRRPERAAHLGSGSGTDVERQLHAGRNRRPRHHPRIPRG